MPSHYYNQCLHIANWTLRNKFQWTINHTGKQFRKCHLKKVAILSRPQWVNSLLYRTFKELCISFGITVVWFSWISPIFFRLTLMTFMVAPVPGSQTSSWWRHQMKTFSALLALCAGNSPVTSEFPSQKPVNGALMFSLICAWINAWENNHKAGDLRCHRAHYDVIVMWIWVNE